MCVMTILLCVSNNSVLIRKIDIHAWSGLYWIGGHPFQWRHNGRGSVSNHQPHHCLLNCWFRHRSKKTSKLCVTGLFVGNSPGPVNSPHKWPVTRKRFPFDDVIMTSTAGLIPFPLIKSPHRKICCDIWYRITKGKTRLIEYPNNSPNDGHQVAFLWFLWCYGTFPTCFWITRSYENQHTRLESHFL